MPSPGKDGPAPRWPWAVASLALLADQLTKNWFTIHFALYESRPVIPGFFNFTLTRNTGAAFSLFQKHPLPLLAFSIIVFGLMVVFRDHLFTRRPLEQFAFGFISGGILGNLIDRTKYGYVIDFIDWYIGDRHWPIFNLADSFICIGVGLYFLANFRHKKPVAP